MGVFVIIACFILSDQQRVTSISQGLVVDQLNILKKQDYETIARINQKMERQRYPAQLWVRVLKNPPKKFFDGNKNDFDGYTSLLTEDYLDNEIEHTYRLMKGEGETRQHTESWYYDHISILLIVPHNKDANIALISDSSEMSDMQRQYLRCLLPKQPLSRWKLMLCIRGYAWFVAGHADIDYGYPGIEQLSSAVLICYLAMTAIIAIVRFMRKDTDYHGGSGPDQDNDYWIEDEHLTYGVDWNGIDNDGY